MHTSNNKNQKQFLPDPSKIAKGEMGLPLGCGEAIRLFLRGDNELFIKG